MVSHVVSHTDVVSKKIFQKKMHQSGIFPGTGNESNTGSFYNYPLKDGAGDSELIEAVEGFIYMIGTRDRIWDWRPDLIFITCGADGHKEDPLTGLAYSTDGYVSVAQMVRERFPDLPILLGGAGGYLPDTRTPEIWANVAIALSKEEEGNGKKITLFHQRRMNSKWWS